MVKVNKNKSENPVFVLGTGWHNSLGVVRGFGRRGIPVYVIGNTNYSSHRLSKYGILLNSGPVDCKNSRFAEFLIAEASCHQKPPVIIPTNDEMVLYIQTWRSLLEPHVHFTSAPIDVSRKIIEKAEFYPLVHEMGIPCPQTFICDTAMSALASAKEVGYPCLLKPSNSYLFQKHFPRKCFFVHDPNELVDKWKQTETKGIVVFVQEFIPASQIYMWYGYYSRSSKLVAYLGYHKIRQWPPDFGSGCLVRTYNEQGMIDVANRILRHISYYGIVEPEFKYDPRDKRWKILEINGRTSTQNRLPATLGLDMEYLAYLDAIGKPLLAQGGNHTGVLWTSTANDFASAFSEPSMTIWKWIRSRRGRKVYAIFAWDDPLPAVRYFLKFLRIIARTVIKRWTPYLYERIRGIKSWMRASYGRPEEVVPSKNEKAIGN